MGEERRGDREVAVLSQNEPVFRYERESSKGTGQRGAASVVEG